MNDTAQETTLPDPFSDPAFLAIAQEFQAGLAERADELQDADNQGDHVAVRRCAHRLKGAAGGYGLIELGQQAACVERMCGATPKSDATRQAVAELVETCRLEAAATAAPMN